MIWLRRAGEVDRLLCFEAGVETGMAIMARRMRLALALVLAAALPGWCLAPSASAQAPPRSQAADPFTTRLELMQRTMRIARDWHVGRPGKPELISGAIEGLLARVDPEAEVYSRSDLRRVTRFAATASAEVGLEVRREAAVRRQERAGYRVVSSRDASPAALAGLKAGDLITHVDGRAAGELSHLAMVRMALPGAPGTSVRLTVERAGENPSTEVVLTRSETSAAPLSVDLVAPGVARIRLAAIDVEVAASLQSAAAAWSGATRGLVLDLRGTAEGSLDGARAAADAFLETGPVLRTAARTAGQSRFGTATPGDVAGGRPLVALVDEGTAGPAEILAAALQESHRARIVGSRTAGRGALRTLVPLGQGGEKGVLRLTTERLLTPAGAPLDGKGVQPDIVAEQAPPSPGCRTLDIADAREPGRCVRRAPVEDGQLSRAIALLDEAMVAAKATPPPARP